MPPKKTTKRKSASSVKSAVVKKGKSDAKPKRQRKPMALTCQFEDCTSMATKTKKCQVCKIKLCNTCAKDTDIKEEGDKEHVICSNCKFPKSASTAATAATTTMITSRYQPSDAVCAICMKSVDSSCSPVCIDCKTCICCPPCEAKRTSK